MNMDGIVLLTCDPAYSAYRSMETTVRSAADIDWRLVRATARKNQMGEGWGRRRWRKSSPLISRGWANVPDGINLNIKFNLKLNLGTT